MPGVALPDRHHRKEPRPAHLVAPHAGHVGDARQGELLVDRRRAQEGAVVGQFGRGLDRRGAEENRVVAVVERLDLHHRLFPLRAGIVARPLAERPLRQPVARVHKPLDHDLGIRGDGQPRRGADEDLDRLADEAAGDVVLVLAVRDLEPPDHEQSGMHSRHHGNRARLPALVIAPLDQVAMLAF